MISVERLPSRPPLEWLAIPDRNELAIRVADNLVAASVGAVVRVFCGEANYRLYGHTAVVAALKRAKEQGASIAVITGPILVGEKDGQGRPHHPLVELHNEGIIAKLLHRPERGPIGAFHIVPANDGYRYYEAHPRPPKLPPEKRLYLMLSGLPIEQVQAGISVFDDFLYALEHAPQFPGSDQLPIILTQEEYEELSDIADARGVPLDCLAPLKIHSLQSLLGR